MADLPIRVSLAPEMRRGVYANFARISHGQYDFTLDFCKLDNEPSIDEADGVTVLAGELVARVVVSPTLVFQIARAIAENVATFEQRYHPITPASPDGSFPDPASEGGSDDRDDA